ncbi:MAG: zinc ribbon domain-containing protein [Myxococcota bacterium]
MPVYEYQCAKCSGIMEIMQKMSDPPPKKCASCGSTRVSRIMSQTSFVLKGEGWYITDYARKEQKAKDDNKTKNGSTKSKESDGTDSKAKDDKPKTTKSDDKKKKTKSTSDAA